MCALVTGVQTCALPIYAPDLGALFLAQAVEELHEPGHQIEFGQHQVDGEAHAQLGVQLLNAQANRRGMTCPFGCARSGERRLGKEVVRACKSRWAQDHYKNKKTQLINDHKMKDK